jgi:hypothetical protein
MMPLWALGFVVLFVLSLMGTSLIAAADLVRRSEGTPWWWSLCVAPLGVVAVGWVAMWLATWEYGYSSVETGTVWIVLVAWASALVALCLVLQICAVRLLRPEGEGTWNRRTLVPLGTCLLVWLGSGALVASNPEVAVLWMPVCCFALGSALCQVTLGRTGTRRLDGHRATTTAILCASAATAWATGTVSVFTDAVRDPAVSPWVLNWVWINGMSVAVLALCMRWAHGRQRGWPWLVGGGLVGLACLPGLMWRVSPPVVPDFAVSAWVDLTGAPGGPARPDVDGPNMSNGTPSAYLWGPWRASYAAETPMTAIQGNPSAVIVGDGRWTTSHRGPRLGEEVVVERVGDQVFVAETPVDWPLGVHAALQAYDAYDRVLVKVSEDWTVQDFVSMCASFPGTCSHR